MVVRNSVEAELKAVAHGICEIMWIRRLLEELKIGSSSPMKLYCDNMVAISIARNSVLYDPTKCHAPIPRLGGRRGRETGLGLFSFFFRRWWA